MSIADKLTTIAENQQMVYDAGFEAGKSAGGDNVLLYAENLPTYNNAAFPDGYELELIAPNMKNVATFKLDGWSNVTGLKMLKLVSGASFSNGINAVTTMNGSSIEIFDISEFPRNFTQMLSTFLHCYYLREIIGELDLTNCAFNAYEFYNCYALEEIRIKAGSLNKSMAIAQSDKLSAESIQSIIDGLADLTGQTTQTLTLHAAVGAKLTDEQKATVTAKNWTLVY